MKMTSVDNMLLNGDIDGISEIQLKYVVTFIQEKGYKNEEIKLEAVGAKGDNYVANVKRIIVKNNDDTFKMIAKFAPSKEDDRAMWNKEGLFRNEIIFYNEIFPLYDKLQDEANVPQDERLRYPKCYGVHRDVPNEVVLLEDLSVSGFVMLNRLESLKNEEVKLVLKDMAKLHSLSFVLRSKQLDLYKDITRKFVDIWDYTNNSAESDKYLKVLETELLDILESQDDKDVIKEVFADINEVMEQNKANVDPKYCAILQGDCWTNNVMFLKEEGRAVQCVMIDYQTPKEWFIVYDIASFIFTSTNREVRQENYHEWIDYYYDRLDKSLANFGFKVSDLYPREILDRGLKNHGKFIFLVSMIFAPLILKRSDEVIDDTKETNWYSTLTTSSMKKESLIRLKQRVEEVIGSFKEYGYL